MKKLVFYSPLGEVIYEDSYFEKYKNIPRKNETVIIPNNIKTFDVINVLHDYRTNIISVIILPNKS